MKAIDEKYLRLAISEAQKAEKSGEIPIGCVIVRDREILSRGSNLTETDNDPTAHAEILAIRRACKSINNWRLDGACIYVTLEPCPMCMGAIMQSRISRLVFGSYDDRYGAAISKIIMPEIIPSFGDIQIIGGVLKADCKRLLDDFFANCR